MGCQIFHIEQVTECPSGLTLPEACGENLRSAIRMAWHGSKLVVPRGIYALVAPILIDKDIILEGCCANETIIYNCIPMRFLPRYLRLSTLLTKKFRHCIQVRGESHESTVSIVGITLQQRRSSDTIDYTDVYVVSGVCIDVRRGRSTCSFSYCLHQDIPRLRKDRIF